MKLLPQIPKAGGGPRIAETAALQGTDATLENTTTRTVGSTTVTGLPLDWTQMGGNTAEGAQEDPPIRYPLDVAAVALTSDSDDDKLENILDVRDGELVLVGTHGQKITHMGPDFATILRRSLQHYYPNNNNDDEESKIKMKKIILRSHVIHTMQGLEDLPGGSLELLELYDNQVQALVLTPNFAPSLQVLDMSYNSIREMDPVATCPNLRELYLANNKIKVISGLSGLKQLQKLDLGANRIRVMPPEELAGLTQLKELWLGKNKIETMAGLQTLTQLRRLDLQSNRLTELPGAEFAVIAPNLEELYLAHNGLTETPAKGGWLEHDYPELIQLDLSRNQLTSVNDLGGETGATKFPVLEELWMSGNAIAEWSQVQGLAQIPALETVYLEYNPIQSSDPLYRKSLAQLIPQLKQIDATMISSNMLGGGLGSGLVIGGGALGGAPPPVPEQERMRQYQEMALQRARQEQQQQATQKLEQQETEHKVEDDSDDSGAENAS